MRLFLAVELGETVRRAAVRVAEAAARELLRDATRRGVAWVAPQNLHVTVKFLGEVDAARSRDVTNRLASGLATPVFDLSLGGLGVFPPTGPPRTIWVGFGRGAPGLVALQAEVEARLDGLGFPAEHRPFHAHLTLARVKEWLDPRVRESLGRVGGGAPASCQVDRLTLFESRLAPRGATYSIVETFPLSGIIAPP
jgi:2'-5' RNA ligase